MVVLQTVIITIPRNQARAEETKKHLEIHSFPQVQMLYGYTAKPGGSILKAASKSHHKAAQFASQFVTPIIIAEDDCRIANEDAVSEIYKAVHFLNCHRPNWKLLAIGHCGLGPIIPLVDYPWLCHSTLPFSGICYILNPKTLSELIRQIPKKNWRRPYMVEGWLKLPLSEKYAFTYSLTTMGNVPKEIANVPILSGLDLTAGSYTITNLHFIIYTVIIMYLILRCA